MVIDTSAIIAILMDEPEKAAIVECVKGAELVAPRSVHWEIGNAFSAMFKRNRITLDEAKPAALAIYERMSIRFVDVKIVRSLELAEQLDMYAYDAYILACALDLDAPLLTLDKGLANAASPLEFKLWRSTYENAYLFGSKPRP